MPIGMPAGRPTDAMIAEYQRLNLSVEADMFSCDEITLRSTAFALGLDFRERELLTDTLSRFSVWLDNCNAADEIRAERGAAPVPTPTPVVPRAFCNCGALQNRVRFSAPYVACKKCGYISRVSGRNEPLVSAIEGVFSLAEFSRLGTTLAVPVAGAFYLRESHSYSAVDDKFVPSNNGPVDNDFIRISDYKIYSDVLPRGKRGRLILCPRGHKYWTSAQEKCLLCPPPPPPKYHDPLGEEDVDKIRRTRRDRRATIRQSTNCLIHSGPCSCNGGFHDYSHSPPPFRVKAPEFAVGMEFECILPIRTAPYLLSSVSGSPDTSLRLPPTAVGDGLNFKPHELKVPSWGAEAANHAANAARAIRAIGGHVNKTCGLHVHCDVRQLSPEGLLPIKDNWLKVEPWVFNQLWPSRKNNVYCAAMSRDRIDRAGWNDHHNALALPTRHETVEFRVAPGTSSWFHAYAWVEWCVEFFKASVGNKPIPKPRAIFALAYMRSHNLTPAQIANFCEFVRRAHRKEPWTALAARVVSWVEGAPGFEDFYNAGYGTTPSGRL